MSRTWLLALAPLLAMGSAPAAAETPLFAEDSEIVFTIEGPLGELVRKAARSTDPYPATVILNEGAADAQTFEIKLSARGLSRRTGDFCTFPPLRLDFDRDDLAGSLFEGQNRLKLVTHCRSSRGYEQLAVLEHLAYKLYNAMTPSSFRVRAAQVTYRDADGRSNEETYFGFLIEDVDDTAARNGRVELEVGSGDVRWAQLDPQLAARYALFQLMIGNLDWDMTHGPEGEECCHNTKLITADAAAPSDVVPLPYDFDHSGLVDAPYARPPDSVPVRSVTSRYYRGLCQHNGEVLAAAATLAEQRDAFLAIVDAESRLTQQKRRRARSYIESFFDEIADADDFARMVERRCRE